MTDSRKEAVERIMHMIKSAYQFGRHRERDANTPSFQDWRISGSITHEIDKAIEIASGKWVSVYIKLPDKNSWYLVVEYGEVKTAYYNSNAKF